MIDYAPRATVIGISAKRFVVVCPYCGDRHSHAYLRPEKNLRHHRAPACGMKLSEADRLAGYWFWLDRVERKPR